MPVNDDILQAGDFTFEPFNPGIGGDSGALQLATAKTDPQIQYIVKSATPELACNEYIYHKIASALGLNTPEVKLFHNNSKLKYAAGIRFIAEARKYLYDKNADDNEGYIADFCAFQTLYVILNEEDSQEFYLDGQGRLFKLDNAASFNIGSYDIVLIGRKNRQDALKIFEAKLNFTEYDKYGIILRILTERYGAAGKNACLSMFKRFSVFDEKALDDALESLDNVYPVELGDYYLKFVISRTALCERFLREYEEDKQGKGQ